MREFSHQLDVALPTKPIRATPFAREARHFSEFCYFFSGHHVSHIVAPVVRPSYWISFDPIKVDFRSNQCMDRCLEYGF